jgi:general stress protein YciG
LVVVAKTIETVAQIPPGANMTSVLDPIHPAAAPNSHEAPDPEALPDPAKKPRRPRGFAAMDRTKVSEIASKGGKAAHAAGTAHQFSSDEARNAGRKGGVAPHVRRGRGARNSVAQSVTPETKASGSKESAAE